MKKLNSMKKLILNILLIVSALVIFAFSSLAASPYEVTKSGGALIRTSYYESASSVRRAAQGSILWVVSSVKNSAGNTWYKLSDGYWIYSGNVKAHSCSWSLTGTVNATCTSTGNKYYRCNKCGQTKTTSVSAKGHNYSDNVCKTCGAWNTSSLKSKTSVNNVKYYVKTDGAKVHSGPYGAAKTVATLSKGTNIIVTQKVVNASNNTWYKYSGGYVFSDYVVAHNSCSWNSGTVTKKATCTSTGTKVQYCTVCGGSKTTVLAKKSHSYEDNVCKICGAWNTSSLKSKTSVNNVKYYVKTNGAKVHSGPYGAAKTVTTLSKGTEIVVTQKVVNASNNTWYKYSGGYVFSDYVVAHNSCSWNSGTVTKKATCTSTGKKVQKCTVCGGSKTTVLAKKSHSYEDNVCKICGAWNTSSLKSKTSVNNVKYYVKTDGAKVHSGPYGGTKTVAKLSKGKEIVVTQKVVNASKNTWYKYSGGYVFSDYVVAHNSCSWNSGTVTKKATCTSTGTKVQKCKICSKSKTTTIKKKSHKYENNVCKSCGGWDKSSLKSKKAMDNVVYCVITDSAKVYSGPYSSSKTVKKLSKGTKITVTEKLVNALGNTWYKYSGGYVYGKNVKDYALYTAKITLNAEKLTMYVGQEKSIKATVKGPSSKVTWKSSDTSVATVSSNGKIVCKKTGTCTISAKANGKTDTCNITVKQLAAPKEVKFSTLSNGRQFKVSHKAVSGADGYTVTYNAVKTQKTKSYTSVSSTVTVPMNEDCSFKCFVRAYKLIDGKKLYGKSSAAVNVHVHNAKSNLNTYYTASDYTYHIIKDKFICQSCNKTIVHTRPSKENHSFTCGACQLCGKKQKSDYVVAKIYPTTGSGPAYSSAERKDGKNPYYVGVKYSDSYFASSISFNNNLCKLSAVGAAVSYDKEFAKSFLKSCGFSAVRAENSSSSKSVASAGKNDHARYIIGYKKLSGTDRILVAVLVNGYTDGSYEWVSNFNVGTDGLHDGFEKAAEEVKTKITEYIEAQNLSLSKVKIWITGHSRGAAVTGITAKMLNDIKSIGMADVYAYGFATPNGVPEEKAEIDKNKNIFNIVNEGDFVPYVVPSDWGFVKYGLTYKIATETDSKVKSAYKALVKRSYGGLTIKERTKIIDAFCLYSPDRTAYNAAKYASPKDFGRALGLSMSDNVLKHSGEIATLLGKCGVNDVTSLNVLGEMVENGMVKTKIHEAHGMETYLAMVYYGERKLINRT